MRIENVENPDFNDLLDLINCEWPTAYMDVPDKEKVQTFEADFNPSTDVLKVLMKENKAIGFFRYCNWPREELSSDTAHCLDIAVLPEYRRQHIGTMLLQNIIEECKNQGFLNIYSRTFKENKASIGLHKSLGFVVYEDFEDSIIWNKVL